MGVSQSPNSTTRVHPVTRLRARQGSTLCLCYKPPRSPYYILAQWSHHAHAHCPPIAVSLAHSAARLAGSDAQLPGCTFFMSACRKRPCTSCSTLSGRRASWCQRGRERVCQGDESEWLPFVCSSNIRGVQLAALSSSPSGGPPRLLSGSSHPSAVSPPRRLAACGGR